MSSPWRYFHHWLHRDFSLRWRHNERDGVSNHQPHDCLLNRQSSASLAFVRRIHRGPVNSPHKWPVTRKMSPFDDVMYILILTQSSIDSTFRIIIACYQTPHNYQTHFIDGILMHLNRCGISCGRFLYKVNEIKWPHTRECGVISEVIGGQCHRTLINMGVMWTPSIIPRGQRFRKLDIFCQLRWVQF